MQFLRLVMFSTLFHFYCSILQFLKIILTDRWHLLTLFYLLLSRNGEYLKDYDRSIKEKSIVRFLQVLQCFVDCKQFPKLDFSVLHGKGLPLSL